MRLTLAFIVGCIMAGAAWAAVMPEEFAGRWALRSGYCAGGACKALFDIGPCGRGWCGVEVEEGGKCGQTSIHLAVDNGVASEREPLSGRFRAGDVLSGQFRPAKDAEPYAIAASIHVPASGARTLRIVGHTGGRFQDFRRTYPLNMVLERIGEPECHGEFQSS